MGIENINRAKCDKCGKERYSTLKQAAFLEKLKGQGWSGNINKLYCDECSKGDHKTGRKKERSEYFGEAVAINKIGDDYFVKVSNPAMSVYIPYTEFAPLTANSLPSVEYIKNVCIGNGQDPEKIKYHKTNREEITGKGVFVAHLCTAINKG